MEERNKVIGDAYLEHSDMIFKTAYARLRNEFDAEDAMQDTFELALKYYHTYNPERSSIKTWLNNIAHNRCSAIQTLERNKGVKVEVEDDVMGELEFTLDREIALEKAIGYIDSIKSPVQRGVLQLHFVDKAKPRDIEAVTGVKPAYASVIICEFLNHIKKEFKH